MSMHLVRGVYDTGKSNKNKPPSRAQLNKWQKWHKDHNAHMKRLRLPTLTFDQFVDRLHGKTQKQPVRTQLKNSKTALAQCDQSQNLATHRQKYPSLNSGEGTTAKREENVYTGDRLLGIAVMHKSNLVPVFSKEDAAELAKMRR